MPRRGPAPVDLANLLDDDSPIRLVAQRFGDTGHELYLVGGWVRDALLGRPHEDLDFATDAEPEETRAILQPVADELWLQGERFGTVGAEVRGARMEITTLRTERYQPSSRHPDVSFTKDIGTDLSRRDFTINAMALRLPELSLVDPFGGIDDLKRRSIKTPIDPRDSFSDDPLRMLRAFRFASQLDFAVVDEVLKTVAELRDELATVSAERIRDELSKLLLGAAPARALQLAEETGLTQQFVPELSSLKLEQDPVHRHKDVFRHTLAVVERTVPVLELRLAALLHDIGKPSTRRIDENGVSFHHHEVVGAKMAEARLRALRFPNEVVEQVRDLIYLHHRFHTYRLGWSDSAVRRYVRDAGALLPTLNALVRADCTTRNPARAKQLAQRMDELEERIAELAEREELAAMRPALDGFQVMAYLGVKPGPVVKEALDHLLEKRIDDGVTEIEEGFKLLDEWARARGMDPVGDEIPGRTKKPN